MRNKRRSVQSVIAIGLGATLTLLGTRATADAPRPKPDEQTVVRARQEFLRGAELIKNFRYAEALAAFEASAKLRPHAATTYNIGACQRALGQYTLAQKTLRAALEQGAQGELSDGLKAEARGFVAQIQALLATADVTLEPANASILVDGRPLEDVAEGGERPTLVAGTRPPGPGEPAPKNRFVLVLDPGAHVFTLSSQGFANVVLNKVFTPGSQSPLVLELERLPATIHVEADRPGAVVTVAERDVGVAPVDVSRPAGTYSVVVARDGFVRYETKVHARAGERVELLANLKEEHPPITKKWWFWTVAGAALTGAVVGTYFAVRPTPERPPLNGGGLQWTLETP